MAVRFRLENKRLVLVAREAGIDESRVLQDEDAGRFADWAATYRALVDHDNKQAELLDLGRQIYAWLDGGERWLETLLAAGQPPLIVEFQAPQPQDDLANAFLGVPWELLAGEDGHLAADAALRYCPVRRLGNAVDPPAPSDYRLGMVFMAGAPRGVNELDFEAEETAILDATGSLGLDLTVEESGNPELLAEAMARLDDVPVLHLSCHGTSDPVPVLVLEDEVGGRLETDATTLINTLQHCLPRLLFLSACKTAAAGALADALAVTMIRAGLPATLGWDDSVSDGEAIGFAAELYRNLARRGTVEEAAGAARRALLNGERPSRDWHLARLWLGPSGGGALVSGRNQKRQMLGREHGFKAFLDKKGESPVASRDAFVGRRREVQTSLAVLRGDDHKALLIHGMGRLGKSSLAARITHRRPDLTPVVIYGRYDARSIADGIKDACPPAADLIETGRGALHDDPGALEGLLRAVLEGPCRQAGDGKPIILVIDDLEQILEDPAPGGRHRVRADFEPVLRAVLRAFDLAATDSRLLLTSRYRFTLPHDGVELGDRLHPLPIPPMPSAAARKQAFRREQAHGSAVVDAAERKARQALLDRCIEVAGGSPGLQDTLFDLALEAPEEAATALDQMEVYLSQGDLPDQQTVQDFLGNLAITQLVSLLNPSEKELLRAMTLFELPVPRDILALLADKVGGAPDRLVALGLADQFEDLVTPTRPAAAVNALARPLAGALDEAEAAALATPVLEELFQLWGGANGSNRPYPADAELTRLALLCGHAEVLAASAADALAWLHQQFAYRQAADWAQRAVAVLDHAGTEPPLALLRLAGEACVQVGEPEPAREFYARALQQIEARRAAGEKIDQRVWSALLTAHGRLLAQSGEPNLAITVFEQALAIDEALGDRRSRTVTLGDIARLRADKGEVDQALALHQEELQVYEALGDRRSRAATLGDIARLRANKGEVDQALALHQERLQVYEALGDRPSRAVALGDIARLRANKGEVDQALALHQERLEVYEALGDRRSRAVTLGDIARLRADKGEVDQALALHQERLQVYEALGDRRERAITLGDIARLRAGKGEVDQAMALHQETLQVYEALGDRRSRAITLGYIARLRAGKGEVEEALALLTDRLQEMRELGDLDGQGATLWDLARIEHSRGNHGKAVPLIEEAYRIVERLGRLEGICAIGGVYGQILVGAGQREEGLAVLRRSEAGYRQMHRDGEADRVAAVIAEIDGG